MASTQLLKTRNSYDEGVVVDPYNAPWQSGVYRKGYRAKASDPVVPVTPNPGPLARGEGGAAPGSAGPAASSSSGRPVTFKPSNPDTRVNAQTIDFARAGEGNRVYGINATNVYAAIDKVREKSGDKAGGNKQLWDNLSRWTSTDNAQHVNPQQAAAFNEYIKTGTKGPGLKDETTLAATDWALRDIGRGQQHKETFLDSTFGKLLVAGAEIAISLTPAGPAGAAAFGATVGGIKDGFKGAVFGGIEGYGVGKLTTGIRDFAGNVVNNFTGAAGPSQTAGNLVGSVATAGKTAIKGAVGSVGASTVLSGINAGVSLRDALAGGAGAAIIAGTATTPKPLDKGPVTTPPPAAALPTPVDREAEMVRRRKASQVATNLTWDRALQAPMLSKPTLLGGPTRLAA